jgi:hypothetical protein
MTASIDLPGSGGGSFGGNATTAIDGYCTYSVQSIIMELAQRAGMDPRTIDASQLHSLQCRGFTVINQYPCTGSLQSLAQIFMFDPSNYDGIVHFVARGADVVATVTQDDFILVEQSTGVDDPMQEQTSRGDTVSIPETLNLNYFDVDGGLATSLQISQRIGDPRATGSQDLQTAVILNADEAKRVVTINHQVMVENSKAQFNFSLSDTWLQLVCGDNIFLPYNGKVWRLRITQVDTNDGSQDYQLLPDRQSAYVSNVQGYPTYVPTPPPSAIVGLTTIEPIDIHIINDIDDSLGCYLALGRSVDSWQGALIEVSLDGGLSYFSSFNVTTPAVCGTLASSLGTHPLEYPDDINTCMVDLLNPNDGLEAASQTQMQNGTNLAIIGNEVLQFGDATETSTPGTWHLGYWFRGRKGTAPTTHAIGERFVLLDRSDLTYLPMQLSYLGRTLTIRATSLNGLDTDVTTTSFTYTGQAQVEYPVAYLSARRDGTTGVLTWQGVGKLGAGASIAMGLYFAGYQVTLTDGTTTQVVTVATQSYMADLSTFVGPVTATVAALNSLTGAGPGTGVTF